MPRLDSYGVECKQDGKQRFSTFRLNQRVHSTSALVAVRPAGAPTGIATTPGHSVIFCKISAYPDQNDPTKQRVSANNVFDLGFD
jgi:hypothetical protein